MTIIIENYQFLYEFNIHIVNHLLDCYIEPFKCANGCKNV